MNTTMIKKPTAADWRALRQRHQLTQTQLAVLVHRTVDTVRRWERDIAPDIACWHLALFITGEIETPTEIRASAC